MCQFVSWIELPEGAPCGVLFLTDKEVYSEVGKEKLTGVQDNDVIGHGAIRAFYGLKPNEGTQREITAFWKKKSFPPEIARYLESPETLIDTWGRMLKSGAIDYETAFSIMNEAPKLWREGLSGICLDIFSRDADYSYRALRDIKGFTEVQRDKLQAVK